MTRAYYNEIDPAACAILRQLIDERVIAPGDVDSRSIKEVTADDIRGYTQCHWFAGGGLWSVAARMAGWPDARPLWSASCPCQPISAAGKRLGADDPRHLWPDLYRIFTAALRAGFAAPVIVGEQVAGALGYNWFDGVRADLACENVAARTVDFPAGAVDAPQQRNRLYWIAVADAQSFGERDADVEGSADARQRARQDPSCGDERDGPDAGALVDASLDGRREGCAEARIQRGRPASSGADVRSSVGVTLGDTERPGLERHAGHGDGGGRPETHRPVAAADVAGTASSMARRDVPLIQGQSPARQQSLHEQDTRARGRNGTHWSDAEWIICHDGKARRAKPGLRLLVNGLPGRVDLWRVGGNAIVPEAAAEVLAAFLEAEAEMMAAA